MSFLRDLCSKKRDLKPTVTKVTYLDGRKFEESDSKAPVEVSKAPFGFVVDSKPDKIPAKITDFVFLGSQDCCDLMTLTDYDITRVLSVGVEAPVKYDGIVYEFVRCLDLPESKLDAILDNCLDFMRKAVQSRHNVLVHCNAGVSRSASVVIAYLMLVHGYNYSEAFSVVKNARSCIRPNDSFVQQLRKLEAR